MNNTLDIYQLKNGMILLGERIENVHSASFQFLLPAGASLLPDRCCGASSVINDWLFRGAGDRSSRELIEAFDRLGVHRHASTSAHHLSLNASLEAGNLPSALELYADVIGRPQLAAKQFELSRQLAVSELQGLDDDPRQKIMTLLYEQFYPDPFGRPAIGKLDQLQALPFERTADIVKRMPDPSKTLFSICGNYDFDAVCKQIEILFDAQSNQGLIEKQPASKGKHYSHFPSEGAQVHIGLMTPMPTVASEFYYEIAAAVSVLSGSMSSRLFTEVREKRGLCYAVGANYRTMRDYAGISCYAGTTPDKAQQTLDVILEQFRLLKDGISTDELQRAKVGLKTSLIMQGESTCARSSSIAADHFLLGRVRELAEIREKIETLSVDSVLRFLQKHPFEDFTIVTIGPNAVTV
ncbi:MAG: insulinase family protein [Planctomycetota bacterium]|nr:MAG: insulinase family protein [Planctomycetota bacterium]RKY14359.1 MAG: insulinase family protein [Planctomycetota bacterium]